MCSKTATFEKKVMERILPPKRQAIENSLKRSFVISSLSYIFLG
jgi:hypothetical protein